MSMLNNRGRKDVRVFGNGRLSMHLITFIGAVLSKKTCIENFLEEVVPFDVTLQRTALRKH